MATRRFAGCEADRLLARPAFCQPVLRESLVFLFAQILDKFFNTFRVISVHDGILPLSKIKVMQIESPINLL